MPTPAAEVPTPFISSEKYEVLNCSDLKVEITNLGLAIEELSLAQEERSSKSRGHLAFYGWGTGNSLQTVELAKAKGEMDAASRAVENKKCSSS